jgi:hypothetical protein
MFFLFILEINIVVPGSLSLSAWPTSPAQVLGFFFLKKKNIQYKINNTSFI